MGLKGLNTDTFLFGLVLIDIFKFYQKRKVRIERKVPNSSKFVEKWVHVAGTTCVNGLTLKFRL